MKFTFQNSNWYSKANVCELKKNGMISPFLHISNQAHVAEMYNDVSQFVLDSSEMLKYASAVASIYSMKRIYPSKASSSPADTKKAGAGGALCF